MNKKWKYRAMAVLSVGMIVWSVLQILSRIKTQQSLVKNGYHWDILGCEVLFLTGCYVLLLLIGGGRIKRTIQESR